MNRAFLAILPVFLLFAFCGSAQTIRELEDSLEVAQTDQEKVNVLNELAHSYARKSPEKAITYAKQAMSIAIEQKYGLGIARVNNEIGLSYQTMSRFSEALKYYLRSLEQYEALNNKDGIGQVQYNLSSLYQQYSDYKQSMDYAVRSLSSFKQTGNKVKEAKALEIVGSLFFRQDDFENADKYYHQALDLYRELGDTTGVATSMGSIGMILAARGESYDAIEILNKALDLSEKEGDSWMIQSNLNNLGLVEKERGNYKRSLDFINRSYRINAKMGNELNMATNIGNKGSVYLGLAKLETGDLAEEYLDEAINNLDTAISRCLELQSYDPAVSFYRDLSEAYTIKGQSKKALQAYQLGAAIKDSIHSMNNKMALTNMSVSHELAMANRDLMLNQQELKIKELQLGQSRQQVLLYAVSLVALVCLTAITIYFLRGLRERNKRLEKKNERYAAKMEEQVFALKKHTKVLDEITYMQAHDVREPVSTILGLAESFNYEDPSDPDNTFIIENLKVVTEKLDKAVREVIQKKEEL